MKPPRWREPGGSISWRGGSISCERRTRRSKPLLQPPSHPREISIRPGHQRPRLARLAMLELGELRIDQKSGGRREGRSAGRFAQASDAERAADAHLTAENVAGEIGKPGELAGAAHQNDASPWVRGEWRGGKPVAHHFQDLLD